MPVVPAEEHSAEPPAKQERFVLFTPGGPLIVHLDISIDNRPQFVFIEELLKQTLKAVGANDGEVLWTALIENPVFADGQLGNPVINDRTNRKDLINNYDLDRDAYVQPEELAGFLTQNYGGGRRFSVRASDRRESEVPRDSTLFELLDVNRDDRLSETECAAAPARIRSRDADDNEMVAASDFDRFDGPERPTRRRNSFAPDQAIEIREFTTDSIFYALCELNLTGNELEPDAFALAKRLPALLDKNGSGGIDQKEMAGILDADPDIHLKVVFLGRTAKQQLPLLEQLAISDDLADSNAQITSSPNRIGIGLSDWVLEFSVVDQANESAPVVQSETQKVDLPRFASLQVEARVGPSENPLFDWFDSTQDGRLSLREIQASATRLNELDRNGDGFVGEDEIPGKISCVIVRGGSRQDMASARYMPTYPTPQGDPKMPAWLAAMDQNSDGDVSPREFLGSPEKFRELDANADGFLNAEEGQQ